jgi:hypothetical protein
MRWTSCFLLCAIGAFAAPQSPAAAGSSKGSSAHEKFRPFTGRIAANKVRLRARPEMDSHIVKQVAKGDLLVVTGEEGDFYAVQPPKGTKAYVFRTYVLDGIVEANRVNIRLEPHPDAPIIGQLAQGEKVDGQVCPLNHKWLEISPPKGARFYVAKEYVSHAGGPDYAAAMEKRKAQLEEVLAAAYFAAEAECKKEYEQMAIQPVVDQFEAILKSGADFPDAAAAAKEGLALLKETYLQKKIAFLEAKASLSPEAKQELLERHRAEAQGLSQKLSKCDPDLFAKKNAKRNMSDKMRFWDTIEESLYLSWTAFHAGKKIDDFYAEQKANATVLQGTIEPYDPSVKNSPGDYVLRGPNRTVSYLYSTQVDLSKHIGQEVTLLASPRPNNHFAFPAYFILGIEGSPAR